MVFLITFTCYGAHLPGDARGSYDHVRQGGRKLLSAHPGFEAFHRARMRQPGYLLADRRSRAIVRDAIVGVCRFRSWFLCALHVRTNHVHGVVETNSTANRVLNDWKAYSTRALRTAGLVGPERIVWGHSGNVHFLSSAEALADAIHYVLECQGEKMEYFVGDRR